MPVRFAKFKFSLSAAIPMLIVAVVFPNIFTAGMLGTAIFFVVYYSFTERDVLEDRDEPYIVLPTPQALDRTPADHAVNPTPFPKLK